MPTQEDRDLEEEFTTVAGGRTPRGGEDGVRRRPLPVDHIGRFTLLERIGMGGMGELHAAYDPRLDRKIALKLVRRIRSMNAEFEVDPRCSILHAEPRPRSRRVPSLGRRLAG